MRLPPAPRLEQTRAMTKLLEKAVEAVRALPVGSQDEIVRAMLQWAARGDEPETIDPEHLPSVLNGLAQIGRGEFASDAQVEAAFRRFDP
jgi:hypothetical protein